jgi:hypothetical protein
VIHKDNFGGASQAVTDGIPGGMWLRSHDSQGNGGNRRTHPDQMRRIVVDLEDEPLTPAQVAAGTQNRTISPAENSIDDQLEI